MKLAVTMIQRDSVFAAPERILDRVEKKDGLRGDAVIYRSLRLVYTNDDDDCNLQMGSTSTVTDILPQWFCCFD